ncbi:hypothetical protein [Thauera butanivorans]|uniref:Butane monooxygenase hydroxylase BMOH gamma subunit n=1 Tax=Thauera butanivorans TaxID=86174 RepID=Q8KQE7_9RHOO|nr:hypothetical protein [Thauera butanivorans]AAM19730.1 butane monooxygenase hydroxylase BMOH gamma subunit [Thauera butanivorans]
MSKQVWYNTPVRDEWIEKITAIRTAREGTDMLARFRAEHTGPDRTTYDLKKEYNWIESRIEMRVSQLHAEATASDEDLLTKTIDGRCAKEVAAEWLKKAADIDCHYEMERLCVAFRKACKPPMMPINFFAPAEKELVAKLMKLRAPTYLTTSLDELREARGVTMISVQ